MIEKKIKILLLALGIMLTTSFVMWYEGLDTFADSDLDGIVDSDDNCPNNHNPDQVDFDNDSKGNECDFDDDNDNVLDKSDAFDTDPTEWSDFDSDKIGDNTDPDDDNDKIVDAIDAFDTDPKEWADFDFDQIGTNQDLDDDNDGIIDTEDPTPVLTTEQWMTKYLDQIQNCAGSKSDTSRLLCYATFFDVLVENEESNSDALELALTLSKIGSLDDCHFVSHEIGHAAFGENNDVTSTLSGIDSSICRGGFYHGVLSAYFHNMKEEGKSFPNSYSDVCDGLVGTVDYLSCLHGLGHGLMHYYVSDINLAVKKCNELSYFPGIQCLTGAFMQHADNELTRAKNSEDVILKICVKDDLADHDYILCNMQLGTAIAFHTDHEYAKGEKICVLLREVDAINYCLEGLDIEIKTAKEELVDPITRIDRPFIQPFWIKDDPKWAISIVSKSLVSEFDYENKTIEFKTDKADSFYIFAHKNLIGASVKISLNDNDVAWKSLDLRNHEYSSIFIEADEPGFIKIVNIE